MLFFPVASYLSRDRSQTNPSIHRALLALAYSSGYRGDTATATPAHHLQYSMAPCTAKVRSDITPTPMNVPLTSDLRIFVRRIRALMIVSSIAPTSVVNTFNLGLVGDSIPDVPSFVCGARRRPSLQPVLSYLGAEGRRSTLAWHSIAR